MRINNKESVFLSDGRDLGLSIIAKDDMKDEVLSKHTLSSSVKTRPAFNNVKPKDWYLVFD